MRKNDLMRLLHDSGMFSRRKRRWQPTQRWRAASAENLSLAPRRRSAEESWQIKRAVRNWKATPEGQRPTQQDLARSLGVSKQRINFLVHTLPPADPWDTDGLHRTAGCDQTDRISESSVIPAHIAARQAFLRSPAPSQSEPAQPPVILVEQNREQSKIKLLADTRDAGLLAYVGHNPNKSNGWF